MFNNKSTQFRGFVTKYTVVQSKYLNDIEIVFISIDNILINVYSQTGTALTEGEILRLQLIVHGTQMKPEHYNNLRSYYGWSSNEHLIPVSKI